MDKWYFVKTNLLSPTNSKKGDTYEGEFKQFLKDGFGTEKFANKDSYIGSYT